MKAFLQTLLAVVILASTAFAQAERYELGQRLKAFERAWDESSDAAAKQRALAIVTKATPQFFALQLGEAGRTMDRARWALAGKEPTIAVQWLTSLYAVPEKRLYDSAATEVKVTIKAFYKVEGGVPKDAVVTLRMGPEAPVNVPLDKLPVVVTVRRQLPDWRGDLPLILECKLDGKLVNEKSVLVSFLPKLDAWLKQSREQLSTAIAAVDPLTHRSGMEIATLHERYELLQSLAEGEVPETDVRTIIKPLRPGTHIGVGVNIVDDSHWAQRAIVAEKQWYAQPHTFEELVPLDDITLAMPWKKKQNLIFRLACPEPTKEKQLKPLVIALHGAGGTENLFFEGYGNGRVVAECRKRGWFVVAPRSTISFTGAPPVDRLIKELCTRFPIDAKQVFIVGHSMGAAQTTAAVQAYPKLFRAAAALGGGGRVTAAETIAHLPVFVGVGDKDFALGGSKALAKSLKDGGVKRVDYREYPAVEHLVIVREALPDVFKMFDEVLASKP